MTPEQFCYWLQGFVELNPNINMPTIDQWNMIKDHLNIVFEKRTPTHNPQPFPRNPWRDFDHSVLSVPPVIC